MIILGCYICWSFIIEKINYHKELNYATTNRDDYREYKLNFNDCKICQYLNKCTNSKNNQKLITRHIWQNYIEEANHLRHKTSVKKIYQKRKETIERALYIQKKSIA